MEYDEKLHVPLRWWVQATMFLALVWLAFVVALPAAAAWTATGVLSAGVVALYLGYGSARIQVNDGTFTAGRASIPVSLLSDPVALDAENTRRVAGRDADTRAYHLLRPYLKKSLRVTVDDPADPAPYWLVSTRRPEQLAAAVSAAKAGLQRG